MMPAVRAVVFDLGGVVLGSPLEGIAQYEARHGVAPGLINISIALKGPAGAFQRLERGELPLDAFYAEFRRELAAPENVPRYKEYLRRKGRPVPDDLPDAYDIDTVELFGQMMDKAAAVNADMCHALFLLRGLGYRVAALTNNWKMDGDGDDDRKDSSSTDRLAGLFDMIIESSVVGLRKPDPRVYQLTCDRLGVAPSEVAFLDDIGTNLIAARKFGWRTVKVEIGRAPAALEELCGILGLPRTGLAPQSPELAVPLRHPAGGTMDLHGHAEAPAVVLLHPAGPGPWAATARALAARGYCVVAVPLTVGTALVDASAGLDRLVTATGLAHQGRPAGYALIGAGLGGQALLASSTAQRTAKALVLVDSQASSTRTSPPPPSSSPPSPPSPPRLVLGTASSQGSLAPAVLDFLARHLPVPAAASKL